MTIQEIGKFLSNLTDEEVRQLIIIIWAIVWGWQTIKHILNKSQKRTTQPVQPPAQPVIKTRRRTQKEWQRILSRRKFRPDGSYYDEKQKKWIGSSDYKK